MENHGVFSGIRRFYPAQKAEKHPLIRILFAKHSQQME